MIHLTEIHMSKNNKTSGPDTSRATAKGARFADSTHDGMLPSDREAPVLRYSTEVYALEKRASDSGYDIRATRAVVIYPGKTAKVPTGIRFMIPRGHEIQIRSRSGIAERGIFVANSPGTVDCGYRGEVGVILHNSSSELFSIMPGDRIAQAVFSALVPHTLHSVTEIPTNTDRGENGFGSSGVK